MLFSVVVPVYNSSKTIRNCIESILCQSFMNYEIIIINDGSSDQSLSICLEYANTYSNIKLYSFNNEGVAVSRRRGIDLSNGEYILFVDSDDTINAELLQKINDILYIFPNLDIIRYQANLINDENIKNHERYNFMSNINCIFNGIDSLRLWSRPDIKYALYWLFAFKKSLFSNICLNTNIRCYEDVAVIPILIASAKLVTTINYYGYNYLYNNANSLTNNNNKKAQRERAYDFYKACIYAITNILKIKGMSTQDISFFVDDYNSRLENFFYNMSIELRQEMSSIYNLSIYKR